MKTNQYLENAIAGLSPAELVTKLLKQQIDNIQSVLNMKDVSQYRQLYPKIIKTFEVLDDSLNFDAGDLAIQLSQLYQYMRARFMATRVEKIEDVARESINLLTPIYESYLHITKNS